MKHEAKQSIRTSWITIAVLCVAVGGFLVFTQRGVVTETYHTFFSKNPVHEQPLPQSVSYDKFASSFASHSNIPDTNENSTQNTAQADEPLPAEFLLEVPFTTQAPFANWDEVHEETCEEASALTVHYYYQRKTFTPEIAEQELQAMVTYENEQLGFYKDTTAQQTADIIKSYWGYTRVDVIDNPSIEDMKRNVYEGRPVIIPAAGRELNNSHFSGDGPLYHMLVVTGWDQDEFITNDVGTRFGENYRYSYDTVMNAMHDWNGGDVTNGAKRIIVMYPNN